MVSGAVLRTELGSLFVFLHHLQPHHDDEGRTLNRAIFSFASSSAIIPDAGTRRAGASGCEQLIELERTVRLEVGFDPMEIIRSAA
jgi:hypothetical protein